MFGRCAGRTQEVWAAGVTYLRSRDARVEEAIEATPYDRVYEAERPELFCKCAGWRVRGPGEPIAVRGDSDWDVPEPELTLVVDATGADRRVHDRQRRLVAEHRGREHPVPAAGQDVRRFVRDRPGDRPRDGDRAAVHDPDDDRARRERRLRRHDVDGEMRRSFDELAAYLGRALSFPVGAFLMTGTGIVPDPAVHAGGRRRRHDRGGRPRGAHEHGRATRDAARSRYAHQISVRPSRGISAAATRRPCGGPRRSRTAGLRAPC
jgi:hypothetical protein